MSNAEVGMYWRLLSYSWLDGGLSTDLDDLAALVHEPKASFTKAWKRVGQCFEIVNGRYVNPRQERDRAAQEAYREAQVERGRASAEARAKRSKPTDLAEPLLNERSTSVQPKLNKRSTKDGSTSAQPDVNSASASATALGTESLRDSAEGAENGFEAPPFPTTLRSTLPDGVDELKRVAVPFLAAFCNATSAEALAKHGPSYVDVLAAIRGRGCSTRDAWTAFADARIAANGKPLFGASAKKALNYAPSRPKLAAVPARGADWDSLSDRERRLRDPGYVGTAPAEGIR